MKTPKLTTMLKAQVILYLLILITILAVGISTVSAECLECGNSGNIKFYVADSSGNPIEGAVTSVSGLNSITDSSGNTLMSVEIPEGENCIYVDYNVIKSGYLNQRGSVFVCDIDISRADIELTSGGTQSIINALLGDIRRTASITTQSQCDSQGTKYCCITTSQGYSTIYTKTFKWDSDMNLCIYYQNKKQECGRGYTCSCSGGSDTCSAAGDISATSCTCVPKGSTDCTPGYTGSRYCVGNEVWQKYQNSDCSIVAKKRYTCSAGSSCKYGSCIEDAPAAYCGNGKCDTGETCSSCPNDCGSCVQPTTCGDNKCDGSETCESCPGDCGACSICGDTICSEGYEIPETCPQDCKTNPDKKEEPTTLYGRPISHWIGGIIILILIILIIRTSMKK